MIYNNVVLVVSDGHHVTDIKNLLAECAALSRNEPGCERFEVYHAQDDMKVFFLIERWATQADLDRHREAHAFKNIYVPNVLSRAERTPYPCDLVSA